MNDPTLKGNLGNAWLLDQDKILRRQGREHDPRRAVTLPCWIASAAYAHPLWSHYVFMCIALRKTPGVPKAKINLEGATHELMVYALDPEHEPRDDELPHCLYPANFVGQFIAASDADAAARVQQAVQDVIDGTLNPDTDFRHLWVQRFSGSNLKPGALDPDFIAVMPTGGVVMQGMGATNVRNMQQIAETAATLKADKDKPQ